MTQIFLINQFSGTWSENLTQHAGQVQNLGDVAMQNTLLSQSHG